MQTPVNGCNAEMSELAENSRQASIPENSRSHQKSPPQNSKSSRLWWAVSRVRINPCLSARI